MENKTIDLGNGEIIKIQKNELGTRVGIESKDAQGNENCCWYNLVNGELLRCYAAEKESDKKNLYWA